MIKVKGLDDLSKNLEALSKALQSFDSMKIEFDPHDPSSIDLAVKDMEAQIDSQVEPWAGTPFVDQIVAQTKEQLTSLIFERAATLRLEQEAGDAK